MTAEQAIAVVRQLAEQVALKRAEHLIVQDAINTLERLAKPATDGQDHKAS